MNPIELLENSTREVLKTAVEIEKAAYVTLTKAYIRFNNKATQLIGATPDQHKVYVGFLSTTEPALVVTHKDEEGAKGNVFTEAQTVACGGRPNELLASIGKKFEVVAGENGLFRLIPVIDDAGIALESSNNENTTV